MTFPEGRAVVLLSLGGGGIFSHELFSAYNSLTGFLKADLIGRCLLKLNEFSNSYTGNPLRRKNVLKN